MDTRNEVRRMLLTAAVLLLGASSVFAVPGVGPEVTPEDMGITLTNNPGLGLVGTDSDPFHNVGPTSGNNISVIAAPIPEPTSMLALTACGMALLRNRRRASN